MHSRAMQAAGVVPVTATFRFVYMQRVPCQAREPR